MQSRSNYNSDGSFSITELAREILWSSNIPIWGKILRLLQIKSCNLDQIIKILGITEEKIKEEVEKLRKNQFILMSPQRQEGKLIKIYEILPEGIQEIDKTETEGFDRIIFGELKSNGGILKSIIEIKKDIDELQILQSQKDKILEKLTSLENKLEI